MFGKDPKAMLEVQVSKVTISKRKNAGKKKPISADRVQQTLWIPLLHVGAIS